MLIHGVKDWTDPDDGLNERTQVHMTQSVPARSVSIVRVSITLSSTVSSPQSRRQWYGATLVLWNSRLLGGVCHRPDSQHQLQHTHLTGTSSAAAANTHVEHEHGAFEAWRPDLNPDLGGSWLAEDELKHLCSYVEQPRQNERPSVFSQARLGDRESLRHEGILAARFWRPARAWWRRASEEVRSAAMWFS